jgi:hypothetical protein
MVSHDKAGAVILESTRARRSGGGHCQLNPNGCFAGCFAAKRSARLLNVTIDDSYDFAGPLGVGHRGSNLTLTKAIGGPSVAS